MFQTLNFSCNVLENNVWTIAVEKHSFEELEKRIKSRNIQNNATCTPRIPKIRKNAQQITTILLIGFRLDKSVWTTNFRPGALFITRSGRRALISLNTRNIRKSLSFFPVNKIKISIYLENSLNPFKNAFVSLKFTLTLCCCCCYLQTL